MKRVLIVEDDVATLSVLRTLFGRKGWQIAQSRTVADAIPQLDPPPDFVVLDIGLAEGDGAEILLNIRGAGIPTRVAVVSGRLDDDLLATLGPLRPDLVFQKPIRFDELIAACMAKAGRDHAGDLVSRAG